MRTTATSTRRDAQALMLAWRDRNAALANRLSKSSGFADASGTLSTFEMERREVLSAVAERMSDAIARSERNETVSRPETEACMRLLHHLGA